MTHLISVKKVADYARQLIPAGSSITIAVSGGSDSIALLYLLSELKNTLCIKKMVVAHCNYGLRGEDSESDEAVVRSCAASFGAPFFLRRYTGHTLHDVGIEEWARNERYAFLHEVALQTGCNLIATGHTMDDQVETVLMRLLRGTGLNGLRAIAAQRDDGVIRPLLILRKHELVTILAEKKISFRNDASNADTHFFRNKIRHELVPCIEQLKEGALEHIALLAVEAQEQWSIINSMAIRWIAEMSFESNDDAFMIRQEGLNDRAVAAEALRQLMTIHGITPDRLHITALFDLYSHRGTIVLLPNGWRCSRGTRLLYFEKSKPSVSCSVPVPGHLECSINGQAVACSIPETIPEMPDGGKTVAYCDGDYCGNRLIYRTITSVDMFIPFGRNESVNVLQFLSKQGINAADRCHCGMITTIDNKPVWIPGIRQDERSRLTSQTKKAVKIQSTSFF